MKNLFKKYWFLIVPAIGFAGIVMVGAFPSANTFSDFWTINGRDSLRNTAIAFIDSNRDLNLYDGDLNLGVSGARPSTTAGAYPGMLVPFYNGYSSSVSEGDVLIASSTVNASQTGYMTLTTAESTTTVMGVAAETVAAGAVGLMRVSGWAVVKTTGAVYPGDLLVSTGTIGRAGNITPATTVVTGTIIGKACDTATATGDSILVLLSSK